MEERMNETVFMYNKQQAEIDKHYRHLENALGVGKGTQLKEQLLSVIY